MKNKLLFRKAVTQLFLSLCLMLFCTNTSWGQAQTIGSFPYMDGGFEGQSAPVGGSTPVPLITFYNATTNPTGPTSSSVWNAQTGSGASTINNDAAVARTGSYYATGVDATTSFTRVLQSPTAASGWPTGSCVVQYWIKNSTLVLVPAAVGPTGTGYTTGASGITTGTGWTKYTQVSTSSATDEQSSFVGVGRVKVVGSFLVDDVVVYQGTEADNTPPAAVASNGTASGLNISWSASADLDGGAYMVVRYATNPNADNDPNPNGVYAVGHTITNGTGSLVGTVVYIGANTSFTDAVAGSASGTDYYKIYAVDKAFNYATEAIATMVVSVAPAISKSIETLTGFNYAGAGPSTSQLFTVSGSNLTANLVVTASSDFELSQNNFATAGVSTINISGATVAAANIHVRLKAGLAGGVKTGTVSVSSAGANTLTALSLSGSKHDVYYYNGSGLVSSNTSWGVNTDGTGANPVAVTDTYAHFVIANGSATTDAAWILGANSKVIVGNGSAVTLTVDTFPITGTIDATATGIVVWKYLTASPTFGTLDNASEVHFQPATSANYAIGAATAYGKLFIDGTGSVQPANAGSTPTVKTALTVASGSTLIFSNNATPTITVNAGATVTINGTVKTQKATGLFIAGGSIPLNAAATLVLGATSTIEFNRSGTAQAVTPLPVGVSYANLILNDGSGATKTIASGFTVNGTLTISLTNPSAVVAGANLITLANGATIVSTLGPLGGAPTFAGTVNVTYNGTTAQTTGFEVPTAASVLNNLTINNAAGVTLAATTQGNNIIANTSTTLALNSVNLLDANVQVNGASELTLNVSANQANLKQIVFSGATTAKLKLNKSAGTEVAFANSSAQNWGTGTVEITGFQEGKIKFGSSNTALTSTQLGLIKDMADLGKTFRLSDQGYLYYSTTIVAGDAFVVTSANPVYLAIGAASTYVITTTAPNTPTSFALGATPLPAGLSLNTATGAITGTPSANVTNLNVPITLSNALNTQIINFIFNVKTRDAQTITWNDDLSGTRTYGDAAIALTATTDAPALAVSYSSSNTTVATISGSTLTIVGPGTTTITASQAGDPDYEPATNLTKELVVNAKALTIAGAAATGKVYNKLATATITGTLAGGLVGADVVTLVLSATYADANAGVDKPVTSTSTLTGLNAAKYSLTQPTGLVATITKADQLLGALGTSSFKILGDADYDPIPLVTDANVTLVASVAVENPNFTYTSSNESVATIVGGKVHIVGLGSTTIIGEQAASINYNASLPVTQTLKVLPAPLAAWDLYNFNPTAVQQSVTSVSASQVATGISVTPSLSMGNMVNVTNAGNRYRFTSSDWPYTISSGTVAPIDIATGKYMSVAIAANNGKSLSLSSINASFRGGAISSQLLSQFAYSIDGTNFTLIGSPTTFAGESNTRFYSDIDLSGIAALQNLPVGTTVTLRYYASGKSNVTGSTAGNKAWGFFSDFVPNNTRALIIGGSLATVPLVAPVVQNTTMCKGALNVHPTATALAGSELVWYTAATGGTPTTTAPTITATKTVYVAQRVIGDTNISERVPVTVTVALLPATPSALASTESALICKYIGSETPVTFNATAAGTISSYIWTVPTGATFTSGATPSEATPTTGTGTATSIGVSFNGASNTAGLIGSVTVKSVDANGCISLAKALALTTKLPTAPTSLVMTSADTEDHFKGIIIPADPLALPLPTPAVYGLVDLTSLSKITKVGPYMGSSKVFTLTAPAASTAASYLWTLPTGVSPTGSSAVPNEVPNQFTSASSVITVDFAGVTTPAITALPIVVQSVGGCGNSTARTLTLARALPTAPTKLVLTSSSTTPNLISLPAITKVGPYTGTNIEFTLTGTAFTTQGGTATSYAWVLPAGVSCTSPYTTGVTPLTGSTIINLVPTPWTITDYITTTTSTITVEFSGAATKTTGDLLLSVYAVNGTGNSAARTLKLARALPTAPTKLVLTDEAITLSPTVTTKAVSKLGIYAGKTTPLTLTATPFTTQGAEATSFSWVLPAGVNVTAGATLTTDNGATKTWGGTASTLTVTLEGVTTVTPLLLDVHAVNGAGTSTLPRRLTVSTALPSPVAIVGGSLNVCNRVEGFNYTITAPFGANIYQITAPAGSVVTSASSPLNVANTLITTDLTFTVVYEGTTAFPTLDKFLKIQAGNATGYTTAKSLTLSRKATCAGLRAIDASVADDFSVTAYPNPSSDVFNIDVQSSDKGATGVQVYDMTGRLIESRKAKSNSVEVGRNYASGVYNVKVNKGAQVKTLRVIKR